MMTFRPFGPSVTLTARASFATPRCIAWRASWSNAIILAAIFAPRKCGFRCSGWGGRRVGLGSALDDGQDVVFAHQEDLLVAGELELVAGVGGEQDAVADLDLEVPALAVLGDPALADGDDLAALGLVLGRVGQDDA